MRTSQEIEQEIKRRLDVVEAAPDGMRYVRPFCADCLNELLEFVQWEPPCEHSKCYQYLGSSPANEHAYGKWFLSGEGLYECARIRLALIRRTEGGNAWNKQPGLMLLSWSQ